jgi:HEPN domain-containing protein
MDEITLDIVRQWLRKADSDLLNIHNNLSALEVPTDTVCFHAQQAIEKLLKAVLVAHGRNIAKSHDLVKLLMDVVDLVPELLPFEEQLEEISEYGVSVRYPDDYCDPSFSEAKNAFEIAEKIRLIVVGTLRIK